MNPRLIVCSFTDTLPLMNLWKLKVFLCHGCNFSHVKFLCLSSYSTIFIPCSLIPFKHCLPVVLFQAPKNISVLTPKITKLLQTPKKLEKCYGSGHAQEALIWTVPGLKTVLSRVHQLGNAPVVMVTPVMHSSRRQGSMARSHVLTAVL